MVGYAKREASDGAVEIKIVTKRTLVSKMRNRWRLAYRCRVE
jgi:hypothetical protein